MKMSGSNILCLNDVNKNDEEKKERKMGYSFFNLYKTSTSIYSPPQQQGSIKRDSPKVKF